MFLQGGTTEFLFLACISGSYSTRDTKKNKFLLCLKNLSLKKSGGEGVAKNLAEEFQVKDALGFQSRDCSQKQCDEIPAALRR